MSRYNEVKPIKKVLPYSVSDIGGKDELDKWKEKQVIEWAEFQERRQAKFDSLKGMSIMGSKEQMAGVFGDSKATKVFSMLDRKRIPKASEIALPDKEESKIKRLTNKAIDWFLSLQF